MATHVPAGMPRGGKGDRGRPVEKPKNMGKTLKRLWAYVGVHRFKLFMVVFFVIASTLINLRGTSMIGTAIDSYILPGDFYGLRRMLIRLLIVYALSAFFNLSL